MSTEQTPPTAPVDAVVIPNVERGIALVGGPQDGAFVTIGSGRLPRVLFVGPRWLGDGKTAWARLHSYNFPCRYEHDGRVFKYAG